MEQCCGPLAIELVPGKQSDFRTYLAKKARTPSGACAEVHFPDYDTELWSHISRNSFRKALRFQHLSCQDNESSGWRMRRGVIS
jgi:hypothetical protein